ncbi:hypothetical protein [Pedobacter sp. P26]|uniref:hypothetical protein n=1 Tax=Pedobacter sp. P26 TaxID=3423956 RepID=UPI003D67171B
MIGEEEKQYFKGRGAQVNPHNKFLKDVYIKEHHEGIDDWEESDRKTSFIFENSKTIVNKVDSPDVGMAYSLNPYQGCEHGCTYCYARNSHQYWGYSAGIEFERKIIVKKDAPELFKKFLGKKVGMQPPFHFRVIPIAINLRKGNLNSPANYSKSRWHTSSPSA